MLNPYLIFVVLIFPGWGYAQSHARVQIGGVSTVEDLTWSIAGNLNGENPDIFSELQWRNICGVGGAASIALPVFKRFSFSLDAKVLGFVKGTVTDTDYRGDNRTDQVFYAKESASKGLVKSFRPGIEYLMVDQSRFDLSLGVGYLVTTKTYYLLNHATGLNSSYAAIWHGVSALYTVGVDLDFCRLILLTDYSQVKYKATANWNLIDEFEHPVSFEHEARGFVFFNQLSIYKALANQVEAMVSGGYQFSSTGKGVDTLYKKDGDRPKTQLNDVTNQMFSLSLGVNYIF